MHVRSCEFQSRTVCNGKRVKVKFEFQCFSDFESSTLISRTFAQYIRRKFARIRSWYGMFDRKRASSDKITFGDQWVTTNSVNNDNNRTSAKESGEWTF